MLYDVAYWLLFHALDVLGVLTYAYQSFVDNVWHMNWFGGENARIRKP